MELLFFFQSFVENDRQRSPESQEELCEEAFTSEHVEPLPLADLEDQPPTTMASTSSQIYATPTRQSRKRGAGDALGLSLETSLKHYLDRKGSQTPKKEKDSYDIWACNLAQTLRDIKSTKRAKRLRIVIDREVSKALEEELDSDNE